MSILDLICESIPMQHLGASVLDATDTGTLAMERGVNRWEVFPLRGKVPAIPNPHPKGSPERQTCKGECGRQGHGLYDATSNVGQIAVWWGGPYRGANIGVRPPASMFVIDVDPRSGGLTTLARWTRQFGALPPTLTTISGRGDGGHHLYFQHPGGTISGKALRDTGVDLKDRGGYVLAPPSVHPDTGRPYRHVDLPVAPPPRWLVNLLRPTTPSKPTPRHAPVTVGAGFWSSSSSSSIADEFTARTSWADILQPHGWHCLDADPDGDGARWLHPAATSACSATVKNGCLFVYSTNTSFDVTEAGDPHGHTRFRAHAVLNHAGDMSAAARNLMGQR